MTFLLPKLYISAQQIPYNNQYLINNYSLSPAYAGYNYYTEIYAAYRQNWSGVKGAPESKIITFDTPVFENTGIGLSIRDDRYGIFNTFTTTASYAYHLPISKTQSISFGFSVEISENHIDFNQSNYTDDPVINGANVLPAFSYNTGAGLLYRFKAFNFGIALPRILENPVSHELTSEDSNDNDQLLYSNSRHYRIHASYGFPLKKKWQIIPFFIVQKTTESPVLYEVTSLLKYDKKYWFAVGYRKNYCWNFSLGGEFYNYLNLNYTYEYSGKGIAAYSNGSHEISVGVFIGKNRRNGRAFLCE